MLRRYVASSLALLALVTLWTTCSAHVALTYPPARKFDLDFLDNSRTKGPCGMPKGTVRTSLLSGSSFNVTWHLAYPHRGGYKLQVLDSLQRPVLDLTPVTADSEFVKTDVTAQSFPVRLPNDFTCPDCTIRLLRQASEWSNNYRFWSCADVDIVAKNQYKEDCSGHGRHLLSKCRCDRLYYGPRCQYRDECVDDADCGELGKCIDVQATTAPRHQCYCEMGWFGPGCKQRSPVKTPALNLAQYTKRQLSPTMAMYWRILKEAGELEVALVVNGTSYAAIGWRPRSLTTSCRNFPFLADPPGTLTDIATVDKSASPEPEPEPSAETSPSAEPAPSAEPKPSSSEAAKAEPEPEPEATSEPEPSAEPTTTSTTTSTTAKPSRAGGNLFANRKPSRLASRLTTEKRATSAKQQQGEVETSVSFRVSSKQSRSRRDTNATKTGVTYVSSNQDKKSKSEESSAEPEPTSAEPEPTSIPEPSSEPEPEPSSEPEPSVPEPSSEPASSSEPEPSSAEPEPTSASEPEPTSKSEREPETSSKPESSSEPEPSSEPASSSEPEPSSAEPEPSVPEPSSEPASSVPEPEPSVPEPTSASEPEPSAKSEPEPNISEGRSSGRSEGEPAPHAYSPKHDFSPMDCTDMVIGMARGSASRIWDYYTRDRSTPRFDTFWGGKNDLTAALGFEKDGVTTIVFRKKLKATEPTDHSILEEPMHVIWAQGQEAGKYRHSPKSGLERDQASVPDFYRPDELKYHGHGAQRGQLLLNFFDEEVNSEEDSVEVGSASSSNKGTNLDLCDSGFWQFPRKCDLAKGDCEYRASWHVVGTSDVHFTIHTKHTDLWTGIAFSHNERMAQTDAVLGWVDRAGRSFVMDTWLGSNQAPLLDAAQDVRNVTGRVQDGITELSFVRPINSRDPKDVPLNGEQCPYFMFPVRGGKFNSVNKKIWKHDSVPALSAKRVCIRPCAKGEATTTPPPPPSLQYNVEVRLLRLGEGFTVPKPGSPDFDILSDSVGSALSAGALGKVPGFSDVVVRQFKQDDDQQSVIAQLKVLVDKAQYESAVKDKEDANSVENALEETVAAGRVGALQLDPSYLVMKPPQVTTVGGNDEGRAGSNGGWLALSATKLYILAGCVAALVLVALLQATCTIFNRGSKRRIANHKERLIPTSAWKEYNAANTNYAFDANEVKQQPPMQLQSTRPPSGTKIPLHDPRLPMAPGRGPYAQNPYGVPRSTYSLPRTAMNERHAPPPGPGYYTHDRRAAAQHHHHMHPAANGGLQPDFYFMPSQRKYSGEVVRVYVDYNKAPK